MFAAIVASLVIRSNTTATLHGSLGRVIGVLAGVGLGIGARELVNPSAVAVGIVMAVALGIDQLLHSLPRVGLDTRTKPPCLHS